VELRLSFLGPFQVILAQAPAVFATDSARTLFAYLAVEADRPHPREMLATLLWSNRSQATAYSNLRQTLARVRKALATTSVSSPVLTITNKTVQFNSTAAEIDVVRFQELLSACAAHNHLDKIGCPECIERLVQATELYRGEFLQGIYVDREQPLEDWIDFKRETLHRQAVETLQTLTLHAGRTCDYAQMIHFARRQLVLDPWREEAHRQLMHALVSSDQQNAALAQYAICCRILAEQLDTKPSPETQALYEQIRAGAYAHSRTRTDEENRTETATVQAVSSAPPEPFPNPLELDEVPMIPVLFGRQAELARLESWLIHERCQLVALLGIGGVGKTTLAATVALSLAGHFDRVIWRSLLNAPPLDELLHTILKSLSGQSLTDLPTNLDEQLALLLRYLRQQRCLLILDNMESILGQNTTYRAGYEGYAQLIQRLAESRHASCLLLTSRERPKGIARLAEDTRAVRILYLDGLDAAAGRAMLAARGLGNTADVGALVVYYTGNPLALKLVTQTVHDLFGGDVAAFLATETLIFDDIRTVLDQQFATLSPLEQEILLWLAIEREPVSVQTLRDNLIRPGTRHAFMEALRTLERRSLLEATGSASAKLLTNRERATHFALQNVVAEYLTEYLIEQVCQEIEEERVALLHSHALLKARARESVRHSQVRTILQPVATRLVAGLGRRPLAAKIKQILATLRNQPLAPTYAGGNLLNLLLQAEIDLRGYDFSQLNIRQAYLQEAHLHDVNFCEADFKDTVFTHLFGEIQAIHFNTEGQLLVAGATGGRLRMWRMTDGQLIHDSPSSPGLPTAALFSPNGSMLASSGPDYALSLWNMERGRQHHTLQGHTNVIWSLAFRADGRLLASGSADQSVRVWDVQSGQETHLLCGHTNAVTALAFSPSGQIVASGCVDGSIHLWSLDSGEVGHVLRGHQAEVRALVFEPNEELLISGSHDGSIHIWDIHRGEISCTLSGHTGPVRSLAMSTGGRMLASGGGDHFICLWDIRSGQLLHTLLDSVYATYHLAFSPNDEILASVGQDYTVSLWDVHTGEREDTLRVHANSIYSLAFSPNGRLLASGGEDRVVRVWEMEHNHVVRTFTGHTHGKIHVAFTPDGEMVASGSADCTIRLWEVRSGEMRHLLQGHRDIVECIHINLDGELLASASRDGAILLWEINSTHTGRIRQILTGHSGRVIACAFSPNGRILASCGMDQTVRLWEVETGQLLHTLYGHVNVVNSVAFRSDGRLLISSSYDGTVRLWDPDRGEAMAPVLSHKAIPLAVAFYPDGEIVATGNMDHSVCLWHLPEQRLLHTLCGHTATVESVAFSPDGRMLASSSKDETIRVWTMDDPLGACLKTLQVEGPYTGMKITGATGLVEAQKATLRRLGAVEE
jgi:WD40 repeat protein/DNA-binding SARP family transcriptional activator